MDINEILKRTLKIVGASTFFGAALALIIRMVHLWMIS